MNNAVSCGTSVRGTSRKLRQAELDAWLKENRGRVARESLNALALELQRLGFYSKKTVLADVRSGIYGRCYHLGLPLSTKP